MIKVTLITSEPKIVDIVPDSMTIREFLEKHEVMYGMASTSVDGIPLQAGGMDASFEEHGVENRCIVTCLPDKDNAAQAVVFGSSCVIKSSLSPEQIARVKKFHPEALVLYDEDEPVFAIDINEEQPGEIDENGACFSAAESEGKATITVLLDPTLENKADVIYEQLGRPLMYLDEMEKHILEILPSLDEEENKIRAMITSM